MMGQIEIDKSRGFRFGPVDEHGRMVQRTKQSHPYSYDGFVQWRGGKNEDANGTVYSDRLWEWEPQKHDDLCMKHFGNRHQGWGSRSPQLIEAFLRDYIGDENVKLILVMEYCNQASGYPVWRFDYWQGKAGDS